MTLIIIKPGGGFLMACLHSSTAPYWALPDPVPTPLSPVQSSSSNFMGLGGGGGGTELTRAMPMKIFLVETKKTF